MACSGTSEPILDTYTTIASTHHACLSSTSHSSSMKERVRLFLLSTTPFQTPPCRLSSSSHHTLPTTHVPNPAITPPRRGRAIPPPSAHALTRVATHLRKRWRMIHVESEWLWQQRLIDRVLWKSRLPNHASRNVDTSASRARGRGRGRPVRRATVLRLIHSGLPHGRRTARVSPATLRAAQAYEGGTRIAPHARRNVAAVPEWGVRGAAVRCRFATCGPRVHDAVAYWDVAQHGVSWSAGETFAFLHLFVRFGKDFNRIAHAMPFKAVRDVVRFYFRRKLQFDLKGLRRRLDGLSPVVAYSEMCSLAKLPPMDMRSVSILEDDPTS